MSPVTRSNNTLQSRFTPCAFACVILELKTKRVLSAKQALGMEGPSDLRSKKPRMQNKTCIESNNNFVSRNNTETR